MANTFNYMKAGSPRPESPVSDKYDDLLAQVEILNKRLDAEIANACNLLATAEDARDQMREALEESGDKILVACDKSKKMEQVLISTNKELETQNSILTNKVTELEEELMLLKRTISDLEKEKHAADISTANLRQKEKEVNDLRRLLTDQINLKNALESRCNKLIAEHQREREDHKAFCERELCEKQKMLEQIGLLERELEKIRGESEVYKFENETLKSELARLKEIIDQIELYKKQTEIDSVLLSEKDNKINTLQRSVDSLRNELAKAKDEDKVAYDSLLGKYKQKVKEIQVREEEKAELDGMFKEATAEAMDLQKRLIGYEQLLKVQEDAVQKAKDYEQIAEVLRIDKSKLEKELSSIGVQLDKTARKTVELEKQVIEYSNALQEKEEEIKALSEELFTVKQGTEEYVPVKGDPTDNRLADYINRSPELQGMALMFARESEGIYKFGTKRVFVKVEKDKIMVRVGGGFLNLDEFIELYGPLEVEKMNKAKWRVELNGQIVS